VVEGGVSAAAEVGDVSDRLLSDAPRVLRAAVPLQVEGNFAVGEQIATPSIRCRAAVAFVRGATRCLTEPVIETLVGQVARPRRQLREEPVGFQVVSQVVGLFAGASSAVAYPAVGLTREAGRLVSLQTKSARTQRA